MNLDFFSSKTSLHITEITNFIHLTGTGK